MAVKQIDHPTLGAITLSQNARCRRISLTIKPNGAVRLSFPAGISVSRALVFAESKADWIAATRRRIETAATDRHICTPDEIEALRREAKRVLPAKVEFFARKFGFRYGRVTIRAARSKWGCCTSENNISLSLFLMTLPEHLQNYVVIHELCHTVHHNHSKRFHALADRCMDGREQELRKELRNHHTA